MRLLNNLESGHFATISGIDTIIEKQPLYQRLMALGFHIGKQIQVIRKASFNGPIHVRIGATDIILRESEAKLIQISP